MGPELKQKWVAALRSGQYKQVKGRMTNGEGFCCLGVLCTLADEDYDIQDALDFDNVKGYQDFNLEFTMWTRLERMNDAYGKSFSEIADYIEENL